MKLIRLVLTVCVMFIAAGCAHSNHAKTKPNLQPQTIGFLELKTPYSKAAMDEGDLAAIKKVFDHKHAKTGKPYPCWNALKPFHGKDLPVSLTILSTNETATDDLFALSHIDRSKFDSLGKDGAFSSVRPPDKDGFKIWRIDKRYRSISQNRFTNEAVVLVDTSGSMTAKKKLNTLRALAAANAKFKKVYAFSEKVGPASIDKDELKNVLPAGYTALYDNVARLINDHPDAEVIVITDGRDNRSTLKLEELVKKLSQGNQKIDVVLTGGNARKDFFQVASATKGQMLYDLDESGEITEPYLEITLDQ